MIGVGVIGTGFGRLVHVPAFREVEGAKLVGIASRDPERARAAARELGLPRVFESWRELVECADVQAVSVATPPASHAEIAQAALAAGKAVLCEKPLAMDAGGAGAMLAAARSAGVVHMVGFEFREIPAWRQARELLRDGVVGRMRHASVSWLVPSWADPARPWSWRAELAQGGGILGALGVHAFDYLEWLLGPVRGVAAQLATRVVARPDATGALRPVDAEDCCQMLLRLHDGTPVSLTASMVAPLGTGHLVECYGETGVLAIASANLPDYSKGFAVWLGRPGAARRRRVQLPRRLRLPEDEGDGRVAPFARLARRFVGAIRGEEPDPRPSFEDGLRAQVLLDATRRADRERTWVEVPLPPAPAAAS